MTPFTTFLTRSTPTVLPEGRPNGDAGRTISTEPRMFLPKGRIDAGDRRRRDPIAVPEMRLPAGFQSLHLLLGDLDHHLIGRDLFDGQDRLAGDRQVARFDPPPGDDAVERRPDAGVAGLGGGRRAVHGEPLDALLVGVHRGLRPVDGGAGPLQRLPGNGAGGEQLLVPLINRFLGLVGAAAPRRASAGWPAPRPRPPPTARPAPGRR